jgi:protocatechuate 3,4-dioxygenase beta subunit
MEAHMPDRRHLLRALGATAALALTTPVTRAARMLATPYQGKGPFYPLELPLDQITTAVAAQRHAKGTIVDVSGRLLDEAGRPLAGVRIEIWQVNAHGRYHHQHDDQAKPWDPDFQGFGHTTTAADGAYRFRTVRPVAYPGRAPHIHFALSDRRFATFILRCTLPAPRERARLSAHRVRDAKARNSLIVNLEPSRAEGSELVGRFDIVLGETVLSRTP